MTRIRSMKRTWNVRWEFCVNQNSFIKFTRSIDERGPQRGIRKKFEWHVANRQTHAKNLSKVMCLFEWVFVVGLLLFGVRIWNFFIIYKHKTAKKSQFHRWMRLQFKLIQAYNNYNDIFSRVRNDFYFLYPYSLLFFINIHLFKRCHHHKKNCSLIKVCHVIQQSQWWWWWCWNASNKIQEKWYLMDFAKWILVLLCFVKRDDDVRKYFL